MSYTVYKHTAPNGKVYIGITSQVPERRWNNGSGYKTQPRFYNAIKKHGWENFKHEIISEGLEKEAACKMEQDLISSYNSNKPNSGYNSTIGGDVGSLGAKLSEETKMKMSKAKSGRMHPMYGKHLSQESKNKISESRKGKYLGEKNPLYGKHLSEEVKLKISSSKKGKPNYKLKGIRLTDEHRKHISESHQGPKPWLKGRTYKKSEKSIENSAIGHYKKVICVETNEEYKSIKFASEKTRIDSSTITAVCKGRRKTAGGYHWSYCEE